jgi:hypothetical protein
MYKFLQYLIVYVLILNQSLGTVKTIGLRSTRIQSDTGEIYTLPNGMISEIVNYKPSNSGADTNMSYLFFNVGKNLNNFSSITL